MLGDCMGLRGEVSLPGRNSAAPGGEQGRR
jgi:hypothetical protein